MNSTSRAILQTLLADESLNKGERTIIQRLISGELVEAQPPPRTSNQLLTQKNVAELLSVSRSTVWRMRRDGVLEPVEIRPGTWRYRSDQVATLATAATEPVPA